MALTTDYALLYTHAPTTAEAYLAAEQAYFTLWTSPLAVKKAIFHLLLLLPIFTLSVKVSRYTEAAIYFDGLCLGMMLLVLGLYTGSTVPNLRKLAFEPSTQALADLVKNSLNLKIPTDLDALSPTSVINRLLVLLSHPASILLKPQKALESEQEFKKALELNPVDEKSRHELLAVTAAEGQIFREAEIVVIKMGGFKTPEKNVQHRKLAISQRSLIFRDHTLIQEITSTPQLYDPRSTIEQTIRVFHGTRHSSLLSFQQKGIFPPYRLNEFSRSPTFYTTNDAQQAFEHPLHTHPAYPPGSPVAVFQFDIPTAVIHGHFSPTNGEPPFRVKRFSLVEDLDDWRTFCRQNIDKNLGGYNHDYGIVIGPICVPSSKPFQPIQLHSTQVQSTQVAFCSQRSGSWLNKHVTKIYIEERCED
ncbi:hypothetical protein PGTUg99_028076 [Puccinia graminis f. sp. tritici]|uniref:Uncharacterized protein n=1 Tax=Puccinia graminis f. sp. tritici TaxID=56615 RepID=A0A5B0N283_PUCGR|nr:hypothetical protein PGTUg99_028076 [Puccinia graminis f. sp. tritici]